MVSIFEYPRALWRLRAVFAAVVVFASIVPCGLIVLIGSFFGGSLDWRTAWLRDWCAFAARMAGIHYQIEGAENHRFDQASLVISNHQSLFDIPAAFAALDGHLRMVAKVELFRIPIFGHALAATGFIPVDRSNRGSGAEASRKMAEAVRAGFHIWIAPEGTRSSDGTLQPFKRGAFAVAIDQRLPIQPIVILDSYKACPKGSLLPRPGTIVRVKVLPRIEPGTFSGDRTELAETVRRSMASSLQQTAAAHLRFESRSELAVERRQTQT